MPFLGFVMCWRILQREEICMCASKGSNQLEDAHNLIRVFAVCSVYNQVAVAS